MTARRSYGSGSLLVQVDAKGREVWYGKWRADGRQVKRRIGLKRTRGEADGITKADAETRLRELMAEHASSPATSGRREASQTMGDLWNRYDGARARKLKQRTRDEYEGYMRVHVRPYFGDRPVGKLTREDVAAFVAHLERRGLSPKTIRNLVMFVSSLFNLAVTRGWVALNPAKGIDLPDPEDAGTEELRYLEPHEVTDLVAAVPEGPYRPVDRALYITATMAGLRTGELLALRWESVDFENSRLRVIRAFSGDKVSSTKGRRQRSVPMAPQVASALHELREATSWASPADLVFADPRTGGRLAPTPRRRRWVAAKAAAGIDAGFVFHDLRHTFGTTCARRGVPLATIAQWMGHQSTSTTEIYAMHAPAHLDGALLGEYFASADPRPAGYQLANHSERTARA